MPRNERKVLQLLTAAYQSGRDACAMLEVGDPRYDRALDTQRLLVAAAVDAGLGTPHIDDTN